MRTAVLLSMILLADACGQIPWTNHTLPVYTAFIIICFAMDIIEFYNDNFKDNFKNKNE